MKLFKGDAIRCPECGDEWEGVVDDYVIPNRVGVDSEAVEECVSCDWPVRVVRDPDGTFDVTLDEADLDD